MFNLFHLILLYSHQNGKNISTPRIVFSHQNLLIKPQPSHSQNKYQAKPDFPPL